MPADLGNLSHGEQEAIKKCIKEATAKAAARAARREEKVARRAARVPGAPVPGRGTAKGKYAAKNAKKKAKKEKRNAQQEEGPEREGLRKYFSKLRDEFAAGAREVIRSELQNLRKGVRQQASGAAGSGLRR